MRCTTLQDPQREQLPPRELRPLTRAERIALAPDPARARRLIDSCRIRCDRCTVAAQLTCHSERDTAAVCFGCYPGWAAKRRAAALSGRRRMLVGFIAAGAR